MASQGPLGAGAGASVPFTTGVAWLNPGNVTTDDSSYATNSPPPLGAPPSEYLQATSFGFSIPADATIDGILVEWKRLVDSTAFSPRDLRVRLIKGGVVQATDKASGVTWPTVEAFASYGGAADLWGGTWTHTDINAANFGAAIAVQINAGKGGGPTFFVNYCRITVTYTTGGGGGGGTAARVAASMVPGARGVPCYLAGSGGLINR